MLLQRSVAHYDPAAIYAARRTVTIDGNEIRAGEPVPRELAKDEKTYYTWWGTRLLSREPYPGELSAVAPRAPAAQPVPKAMKPSDALIEAAAASQIEVANGHAHAEKAPEAKPAGGDENEGWLEAKGRGWFIVHFQGKEHKAPRGAAAAADMLNELRVAAGMAPIAGAEAPQADAKLQPGEEFVDEVGEIVTVTSADLPDADANDPLLAPWEEPDEETPSFPHGGAT